MWEGEVGGALKRREVMWLFVRVCVCVCRVHVMILRLLILAHTQAGKADSRVGRPIGRSRRADAKTGALDPPKRKCLAEMEFSLRPDLHHRESNRDLRISIPSPPSTCSILTSICHFIISLSFFIISRSTPRLGPHSEPHESIPLHL